MILTVILFIAGTALVAIGAYIKTGKNPYDLLCSGLYEVFIADCVPKKVPPDEKILERWHDAYDAAVLEGCDAVECVARADAEIKPKPVKYRNQPWEDFYPDLKRSSVYHHGDYLPWHDPGIRSY